MPDDGTQASTDGTDSAAAEQAAAAKADADQAAAGAAGGDDAAKEAADKAAADKATADAAALAAAQPPEKYELKLPDGSALDPAVLERTATTARELGLSNENAQKVADLVSTETQGVLDSYKPGGTEYTKRVTEWESAALADAEIGGSQEKLSASVEQAKKTLATFFPDTVVQFLNDTGYGSHPDVIRALAKLGKAMGEGQFVTGGHPTGSQDPADKFYVGTTKKGKEE